MTNSFRGNTNLPNAILNLSTPYAFFKYSFDNRFFEKIVSESNAYNTDKDPTNPEGLNTVYINQTKLY